MIIDAETAKSIAIEKNKEKIPEEFDKIMERIKQNCEAGYFRTMVRILHWDNVKELKRMGYHVEYCGEEIDIFYVSWGE